MIKLVIRSGSQAGVEFPLDRPVVRIGRGSGSDIRLQDSQASRQHAEITQQGNQFTIRDLGSTNGTFVNNERITAPRLLQPGDQIRIGDTILASEMVGVAAAPDVEADWESDLWDEGTGSGPASGRQRWLVWGLVGVVVVLLVAVAVVAALTLGRAKETPTPVALVATEAPTGAVVVAPSATAESAVEDQPTSTPLVDVDVPTVEAPTLEEEATAPPAQPSAPPKPPEEVPSSPQELEQLPAIVQEYLGNVPPDQLPEAIATQLQSMSQEQVQEMIGALFPGVDPDQLPRVVAASFPGLSEEDVRGLLAMVFPGQNIQLPDTGSVGGRIALGIHKAGFEGRDLYLARVSDGQLTRLAERAQEPDFSPDGQWLVYFSWAPDRKGLRLIKVDGSSDTELTAFDKDSYPSFAPDGQRISFYNIDLQSLNVINRDGTGRREIGKGEYPAWSPAGDQIVYRGCVGGQCGLVVANADGSNPRQITTHANDAAPRWSPNGGQIAFHSDRDGDWEIYVINSDGSWLRRITLNPATDVMPVWSPNGLRVAFRSDRGGNGAVWATSGIGGGAFKLFDAELGPTWMFDQMDWSE